jgi:hypothetical protein
MTAQIGPFLPLRDLRIGGGKYFFKKIPRIVQNESSHNVITTKFLNLLA